MLTLMTLALAAPTPLPDTPPTPTTEARSVETLRSFAPALDRGDLAVVLQPEGAFLQVDDPLRFRSNQARLVRRDQRQIDDIVALLEQHPDTPVALIGHADRRTIASGPYDDNTELSLARALRVRELLIEQGIDEDRIHPVAASAADPVAVGAPAARDLNRRVEVRLLPAIDPDALELR